MKQAKCIACDKPGNGRCAECFGTGQNIHLNSDLPNCSRCGGCGACPRCEGKGYREVQGVKWTPEFLTRLIRRLRH